MKTLSRRPYLIRAIYSWVVDSNLTPYVLVAADYPGVAVPRQFVKDGQITLNIAPAAVQNLHLDQEPMWFSARFGGAPFDVILPSGSILAVFARENGEGMAFGDPEPPSDQPPTPPTPPTPPSTPEPPAPKRGNHLRVVK